MFAQARDGGVDRDQPLLPPSVEFARVHLRDGEAGEVPGREAPQIAVAIVEHHRDPDPSSAGVRVHGVPEVRDALREDGVTDDVGLPSDHFRPGLGVRLHPSDVFRGVDRVERVLHLERPDVPASRLGILVGEHDHADALAAHQAQHVDHRGPNTVRLAPFQEGRANPRGVLVCMLTPSQVVREHRLVPEEVHDVEELLVRPDLLEPVSQLVYERVHLVVGHRERRAAFFRVIEKAAVVPVQVCLEAARAHAVVQLQDGEHQIDREKVDRMLRRRCRRQCMVHSSLLGSGCCAKRAQRSAIIFYPDSVTKSSYDRLNI